MFLGVIALNIFFSLYDSLMQERLHDQKFISNFFKAKLFTDEEEDDEKEDEEDDDRKEVSGETCRKDVSTGASIS